MTESSKQIARRADIEVRGVTKTFGSRANTLEALRGISMSLPGEQVTAIVGPSGCGKSTLLLTVAGLEMPTEGGVYLDGDLVTKPYPGLGIAFQRDLLLPGRTVLDNVLLQIELRGRAKSDYTNRARGLLQMVGLGGFERYYPAQLSGGMKQRVALCRSLVSEPRILLLDEPFAAVDALTREDLAVQVEQLFLSTRLPTVLLITHSVEEAVFMSDRIYVLSKRPGRVVGDLTIDLPRPRTARHRLHARFNAYTNQVRKLLQGEE